MAILVTRPTRVKALEVLWNAYVNRLAKERQKMHAEANEFRNHHLLEFRDKIKKEFYGFAGTDPVVNKLQSVLTELGLPSNISAHWKWPEKFTEADSWSRVVSVGPVSDITVQLNKRIRSKILKMEKEYLDLQKKYDQMVNAANSHYAGHKDSVALERVEQMLPPEAVKILDQFCDMVKKAADGVVAKAVEPLARYKDSE